MALSKDDQKHVAALAALSHVEDGMVLGLGTGSTAAHFVRALGVLVRENRWTVRAVPTSKGTAALAREAGIPLTDLDREGPLDLTVDGADELDASLHLIKGGGGALLREKIVAATSRKVIIIADGDKIVDRLGAFPLPVEVVRFGAQATARRLRDALGALGYGHAPVTLRLAADGRPLATDTDNVIFDCALGRIEDTRALGQILSGVPGVVDHGLFLGLADLALLTDGAGRVRRLQRPA